MEALRLGIKEKPESKWQWAILSFQHVFAMFGATVLVPILTGLSISVALFASGLGTLIYIAVTKGKVPVYLGSSFAYITAIIVASDMYGVESAFVGLMVVGLIYIVVAMVIKFVGTAWIHKALPPVVIGPMIAIIGISLAGVATGQAGLVSGSSDPLFASLASDWRSPLTALVSFSSVVGLAIFAKGFFKVVPILGGILIGYVFALIIGIVDLTVLSGNPIVSFPDFQFIGTYSFNFGAILMFAPLAMVTIAEHIGDHKVLGAITGEDFLTDPGLDKTLLGDGIATLVSGMLGGPANTTYGENTGVIGMTKVASVYVVAVAAMIAIVMSFLSILTGLISTIPLPVMGGVLILLFGLIAGNGLKVMIEAKVDLSKMRNVVIVSTMLVIGLGGANFVINNATSLSGMALAALIGVILNLILPE